MVGVAPQVPPPGPPLVVFATAVVLILLLAFGAFSPPRKEARTEPQRSPCVVAVQGTPSPFFVPCSYLSAYPDIWWAKGEEI